MAPGGTLFRFAPHFGENVLPHGSHEWLPYSKDEVRLKSVNNNLSFLHGRIKRLGSNRGQASDNYCSALAMASRKSLVSVKISFL